MSDILLKRAKTLHIIVFNIGNHVTCHAFRQKANHQETVERMECVRTSTGFDVIGVRQKITHCDVEAWVARHPIQHQRVLRLMGT